VEAATWRTLLLLKLLRLELQHSAVLRYCSYNGVWDSVGDLGFYLQSHVDVGADQAGQVLDDFFSYPRRVSAYTGAVQHYLAVEAGEGERGFCRERWLALGGGLSGSGFPACGWCGDCG